LMTAFVNPIPSAPNAMEKDTSNKSLTPLDPEHCNKIKDIMRQTHPIK